MTTTVPAGPDLVRQLVGALALVAVALVGGAYLYFIRGKVRPPEVDLAGIDPAIKKAIEEARSKVIAEPDSAQAWGRLGMVLITHDFRLPAAFCLEQAERLDPAEVRWPYFQALGAIAFGEGEKALPKLESIRLLNLQLLTEKLLIA